MSVVEAKTSGKVLYSMSPVLQDKTHRRSAKGTFLYFPAGGGGAISILNKMETNLGALSHSVITVPDIIDNNLKEASPVRAFKFIYTNADTLTNKFDELKTSINNEKPISSYN